MSVANRICVDCGTRCTADRCRKCYEKTRSQTPRTLVCPECGEVRVVNHQTYWAAMKRDVPGRCRPCGRAALLEAKRAEAREVVARGIKHCRGCDRDLPLDGFSRASKHLDGAATYCKDCDQQQIRAWYRANRHKAAVSARRWREANPIKRRSISHNAYGRGRDPQAERIDHGAILAEHGWLCHICGGEIDGLGDLHFDHVVPFARGGRHVAENVRPAHSICNAKKGQGERP